MSTTLTNIPYVRFIRQARTERAALVATQATLNRAVELLKTAPWVQSRPEVAVTMPASNPAQTESSDSYDAYKFSGDCPNASGVQAAFVGMVAYRWKLPASALGNTPTTKITATAKMYSNKFLSAGLRVVAFTSAEDNPAELGTWEFLRGEAGGGVAVISEQFKNTYAGTKVATNGDATVTLITAANVAQYLWVIVQLENWSEIKFEYWIEGAGFVDARTMSATFDKDDLTLDAEDTTPEIPAILSGNIYSPLLDEALVVEHGGSVPLENTMTRELTAASFTIGSGAIKTEPSDALAVAAVPSLYAKIFNGAVRPVTVSGLVVDGNAANKQAGLTTVITRKIVGTVGPFQQQLCTWVSPLTALISFPDGYVAKTANVKNSTAAAINVQGCDMAIDLWWAREKELTLQDVGIMTAQAAFWRGATTAGELNRISSVVFPSQLAAGASLSMPLASTIGQWGTLVLALRILKVTASELAVDSFIGVQGVNITSESISGNGWYPDLTLI